MTTQTQKAGLVMIGVLGILLGGCGGTLERTHKILGRDVADHRASAGDEWCPTITTFIVSPTTVECGGEVMLEIAATTREDIELEYIWDIEGQAFDTGKRAIWKTPTNRTIEDPQKTYIVRGVVSDGECSVTQSVEVKVLCSTAFDLKVHFEFAKAELDATAKSKLDHFAKKLQQSPDYAVLIEGHTDAIGGEPANRLLGQKRARVVRNYLIETWHIDPERLLTRSFGEEKPIAPNESDEGRALNRRAEIFRIMLDTK
ncbi:hypothetical protein CSA56_07290 [candidate division KSB3 bacterium]|uniref:OmpA-like domain-containing protein n=1 Tax=candidate division KSB3 bacterium TaxID=2044937 RepID=A0A2G6KFZ2_9BACT|nr:MAG: hypothetical protein CSA56_07290 [candidate division KSB3 bacterium]